MVPCVDIRTITNTQDHVDCGRMYTHYISYLYICLAVGQLVLVCASLCEDFEWIRGQYGMEWLRSIGLVCVCVCVCVRIDFVRCSLRNKIKKLVECTHPVSGCVCWWNVLHYPIIKLNYHHSSFYDQDRLLMTQTWRRILRRDMKWVINHRLIWDICKNDEEII